MNSGKRKKQRTPFVSPFERYKRVLPMVAAEEAKEREKKEKEDAERLKSLQNGQKETTESISRVYEHFKNVSTTVTNPLSQKEEPSAGSSTREPGKPKKIKPEQKSLSQMRGRKRKRPSNYNDDDVKPSGAQVDMETPVPFLHKIITQSLKNDNNQHKHDKRGSKQNHNQDRKKPRNDGHNQGHGSFAQTDGEDKPPVVKRLR